TIRSPRSLPDALPISTPVADTRRKPARPDPASVALGVQTKGTTPCVIDGFGWGGRGSRRSRSWARSRWAVLRRPGQLTGTSRVRSEEHTSELQSRENL